MAGDPTVDPGLASWVDVPHGSPFPVQNLPYGVVSPVDGGDGGGRRLAVAIGEHVVDLAALAAVGLLDGVADRAVFDAPVLDPLFEAGPAAWRATRARLSELLTEPGRHRPAVEAALRRGDAVRQHLPFEVADFVDFYASEHHAANVGRLFRPGGDPLPAAWRHLPIGYHGRAGTVAVSGTPVARPRGQVRSADGQVEYRPTERLDFELELGFVVGAGSRAGEPVPGDAFPDHVFGVVLVNDWTARDVQQFEYQPLGPFLGKSFATSVSAWVVALDALAPARVALPAQDPEPLPHLRVADGWLLDLDLAADLVPAGATAPVPLTRTSARRLYWSPAQQLAHLTSNGAPLRPGDLLATGTISGPEPHEWGSLVERSGNGERPVALAGGTTRTFLEDGDEVVLSGWTGAGAAVRIGLGEVRGRVRPAAY